MDKQSYRLWHYPETFLVGIYQNRETVEKVCEDFEYWENFEKVDENNWVKRGKDNVVVEQLIIKTNAGDKLR